MGNLKVCKLEGGEKALQDGLVFGMAANDGARPASKQSVTAIMLTPLAVLILVILFSVVGSALAGS